MSAQDHANNPMSTPNTELSISDDEVESSLSGSAEFLVGDIIQSDDHDLKLEVIGDYDEVTGCDDVKVPAQTSAELKEEILSGLNDEYRKKYDEGRLSYKQALQAQRAKRCEELSQEGGRNAVKQLVRLPKEWGEYDSAMAERKEAAGLPDDFKVPKKLLRGNSHVASRLDPDFLPFVPETKQERDDLKFNELKGTSERLANASPARLRDLLSISGVDPDTKLVDIDMSVLRTIHESLNTEIGAFACHEIDYADIIRQSPEEATVTALHRRLNMFIPDVQAVLGEHSRGGLVPTIDKTMKLFCILLAGVIKPGVMDEKKQLAMKNRAFELTQAHAWIVAQELSHNANRLARTPSDGKSLIYTSFVKLVSDIRTAIRKFIKVIYNKTSFTFKEFK